jgi:hypothetical protein
LYANTFSDTEISTGWNATAEQLGYVLYRSTRANGIYDVVIDTTAQTIWIFYYTGYYILLQVLAYSQTNYSHEVVQYLQLLMVVVVVIGRREIA